jgi:hypothetical protein
LTSHSALESYSFDLGDKAGTVPRKPSDRARMIRGYLMALLVHDRSRTTVRLYANHLIGRAERCDLRIDAQYVSAEHATVRWNGSVWLLKDLGSRNRTFLNGEVIAPSTPVALRTGCVVAFGMQGDTWHIEDLAAPQAVAVPLDGGEALVADDALLAVPSPEVPVATLYRGSDGGWKLDQEGEVREAVDGGVFEVDGRAFRLSLPSAVLPTVPLTELDVPRVFDIELRFSVSADEEHVEITAETSGRTLRLGARTHNYLLLELARRRAADADARLPDTSCGWVYQDELCERLKVDPARLNVDVYRIRKQFADLELLDPAAVVERRARTKQLRLGVKRFQIQPL